jgi:hypothetical protein
MTKAKQIREHKKANPQLSSKQIAATLGTSPVYVSQVLHNAKKKMIVASKKDKPTDGQKIVRDEVVRLNKDIDDWRSLYLSSIDEVEQLTQDIIGYRAVISYLQGQLDGLAV